ncbi:type IV pilus biogenesis/stability protein PilW, partial [Methanoregula sp.]|uniref:tetratricopeptide repeat protein n=1 Tax=Methanoregula sp. TaxID=2052170 RepID=UPI000CBA667C
NKMDLVPHAQEKIRKILASKTVIYKKKGETDKALDCINTLLVNEPSSYSLLSEKASLLTKLGRTAEAAEVQKLADANKPVAETPDLGGCLIATATFGSSLSAEVQQLRDFRQNTIYSSAAGTEFMFAFNAWYYSFSPHVADFIRANSWTRPPMQCILTPLISILSLAKSASLAFAPHTELSAVIAGLIASSLISLVYLFPIVLILQATARQYQRSVTGPALVKTLLGLGVFSSLLLLCGYFFSIRLLHLVGSSLFVISVFLVSAFGAALICDRWIVTRTGNESMG